MHRRELIQQVLDRRRPARYLEIGVRRGRTFFPLKARWKLAVDPRFLIPLAERITWSIRNPCNLGARFFPLESDRFFAENAAWLGARRVDVALIDGLHVFEQALRDVLNTARYLRDGGVIVLHDCNPRTVSAAARTDVPGETATVTALPGQREWSGDVWKTIVYLREHHPELSVFVLDCDHGLGIVSGSLAQPVAIDETAVRTLAGRPYEDLAADRERLLDLRPAAYAEEFLAGL